MTDRRATTLACSLAFLLLAALPVGANHVQAEQGMSIVFDHDGDSEWWVEVLTKTSGGDSIVLLEARSESGTNRGLEEKGMFNGWMKWGPETAFRIPPGDRVMFRAHMIDGATGNAAMVDSCWFTHPAGVEQCPSASTWSSRPVGMLGASGGNDVAVGDGDNDGSVEVYVPTGDDIQAFRWTSSGWAKSSFGGENDHYGAIAVGDGNNDGKREVYAATLNRIVVYEWSGTAWAKKVDLSVRADMSISSITLGDIDDDGKRELYFGEYGMQSSLYMVTFSGYTPTVRNLGQVDGSLNALWVGDGDGNGDLELAVATEFKGSSDLYLADFSAASGGTVERVGQTISAQGIAAGDGDRDGKGEVFAASFGLEGPMLTMSKKGLTGWTTTTVSDLSSYDFVDDLAMGDADNDGNVEIYLSMTTDAGEGRLVQVRWTGTAWQTLDLAKVAAGQAMSMAIGDADNDAKREMYAVGNTQVRMCCDAVGVFQVSDHAAAPPPPPPPPPPGTFDATFTGVRGNEWWVQANVATNGPTITKVEVTLDGGTTFKPLAKQTWGPTAWAASYHIVQGTIVQLRATAGTGQTDLSDCHQWIPPSNTDASKASCTSPPPPPPPPPGTFDATFTGVRGNEWWVQANVATNGPTITKVDVTLDGGTTFRPLAKQSWGATAWAASYHVPQGTIVQLRATANTGETDLSSCRQWIPPRDQDAQIVQCGSSPPPPPPDEFTATFSNVAGNPWWVEVVIEGNRPIDLAFFQIDCGRDFHDMNPAWGKWVKGHDQIPDRSKITFVALSNGPNGSDTVESQGYIWPQATPTAGCPDDPPWPRAGSFVTYDLQQSVSGSGESERVDAELTLTFDGEAWTGVCDGTSTHRSLDGVVTSESWTDRVDGVAPMTMPVSAPIGTRLQMDRFFADYRMHTCDLDTNEFPLTVQRREMHTTQVQENGQPVVVPTLYGNNMSESGMTVLEGWWSTKLDLVLDWDRESHNSFLSGAVVATDAPLK